MTLLAGLELARRRRLKLRQAEMFSELWMYPGVEEGQGSAVKEDPGTANSNALEAS